MPTRDLLHYAPMMRTEPIVVNDVENVSELSPHELGVERYAVLRGYSTGVMDEYVS